MAGFAGTYCPDSELPGHDIEGLAVSVQPGRELKEKAGCILTPSTVDTTSGDKSPPSSCKFLRSLLELPRSQKCPRLGGWAASPKTLRVLGASRPGGESACSAGCRAAGLTAQDLSVLPAVCSAPHTPRGPTGDHSASGGQYRGRGSLCFWAT